ncbi:MAG: carboxypeptidase regulatory-like domain-containing protein [Deltaproteobacteria bacterium]|nr:carboxypeptidase regulatory-like domain-containing protein [Deltaproteobacteria bacterium]
MIRNTPRTAGTPVAVLLLVIVAACASVEPRKPAPSLEGRIQGQLIPQDNSIRLGGVEIRAAGKTTATDEEGRFAFDTLPQGKISIVAEKRAGREDAGRMMGITVVYIGENPVQFKVPFRDAAFLDRFCEDCHPYRPKQPIRQGQVIRDVHVSGIVPNKATKWPESLDSKGRVTCESCHTLHETTKFGKFLVDLKSGPLCKKCH